MKAMTEKNDCFVFGSNTKGIHGAGAAKAALDLYGAKWGVGQGLSGRSYAIPTKDDRIRTLPLNKVKQNVERFVKDATKNPQVTFYVTKIGCGLAGFSEHEIAPLFRGCLDLENVKLPKDFLDILCETDYNEDKISFEW